MVEIHEPVRLLLVVEAAPRTLDAVLEDSPALAQLVDNHWLHVAVLSPEGADVWVRERGALVAHQREQTVLPVVERSVQWYRGKRHHLGAAEIRKGT
jgi:uncharacterized protein YbcC (UPF0753/DUF2309 family)